MGVKTKADQKHLPLLVLCIILLALSACSRLFPDRLRFDTGPDALVIYADIQPHAVLPKGQECLFSYVPRLRVWGDGLVYLNISRRGIEPPYEWTGRLSQEEIQQALTLLAKAGFFGKWDPGAANPSGTSFRMGAHLKSKSVEYESGDLAPVLYGDIIDKIQPFLLPLEPGDLADSRISTVIKQTKPCEDQ